MPFGNLKIKSYFRITIHTKHKLLTVTTLLSRIMHANTTLLITKC